VSAGDAKIRDEGSPEAALIEDVGRIEGDAATGQQSNEFVFKAALRMMVRLIPNIAADSFQTRAADGE
jgi:hypothetical protein